MMLRQTHVHVQKNVEPLPETAPKNNSEWITDPNVRAKIIKLLEENKGLNLCNLGIGNTFTDRTPKAQAKKKEKNIKIGLHQNLKHLCFKGKYHQEGEKTTHRRKYLQIIHLIRDLYPEHMKNSYNSIKKTRAQLQNGQRI